MDMKTLTVCRSVSVLQFLMKCSEREKDLYSSHTLKD